MNIRIPVGDTIAEVQGTSAHVTPEPKPPEIGRYGFERGSDAEANAHLEFLISQGYGNDDFFKPPY